ncbi:release factor glutamine methyltransferase [Amylibacter marinus]|uniref:Release factor glutamine methyltransferase n=1 Tax=Amylibacter marinus TaxID=1475483 RepID=A0ABQ5VSN5_9RHOB|nr:peptide chain release factor N(5)-glutamine methyltransferase [Amylibacter marinus]GLQ34123.1 release factor glutamine methyltransferase [Amylibacter marinus]
MSLLISAVLSHGAEQLGDAIDAEILLAEALGIARDRLRLYPDQVVSTDQMAKFNRFLQARMLHQPVSQIIGHRDFWKHRFIVTPDVLDPRPDTETLVEQALGLAPKNRILDLGTGSGCIVLSLLDEWQNATGVGVDISTAALKVAKQNATNLGVTDRIELVEGDWFAPLSDQFDLIVSNPPYITAQEMQHLDADVRDWEPRIALTPEGDGLDAYRIICAQAGAYLQSSGHLAVEIGHQQGAAVAQMMSLAGFADIQIIQDLNRKDRVVIGVI